MSSRSLKGTTLVTLEMSVRTFICLCAISVSLSKILKRRIQSTLIHWNLLHYDLYAMSFNFKRLLH